MIKKSLLFRATIFSVFKLCSYPALWRHITYCIVIITRCFFLPQFRARFKKNKMLAQVDHPLDDTIPFDVSWVDIYMDFSPFWIRSQAALLQRFKKKAIPLVIDFIEALAGLYTVAAGIAKVSFSTTKRPRYYKKLKFALIHIFDPHLMCVPSLHVMVVLFTALRFEKQLSALGCETEFTDERSFVYKHALGITESILYVKQHSVNCIPIALWTMHSLDNLLYNDEEIARFYNKLFLERPDVQSHIVTFYNKLKNESQGAKDWRECIFAFLSEKQAVNG
ncbi:MAG: hypothetical protein Pg6A_07550 [Termitinemataceae bacterium]|nr:MAG: hypothetical protein Pg6A_07550 [Termitinemataceae bacterium]